MRLYSLWGVYILGAIHPYNQKLWQLYIYLQEMQSSGFVESDIAKYRTRLFYVDSQQTEEGCLDIMRISIEPSKIMC